MLRLSLKQSRGFSLLELTVALLLLAIVAMVTVPSVTATDEQRAAAAAAAIAEGYRHARDQSLLGPTQFGTRVQGPGKRVRVFRADFGTNPLTPVYDVYHPLDKNLYDRDFDDLDLYRAVTLDSSTTWRGTCNTTSYVVFDAAGLPWCTDPNTVLLDQKTITVKAGNAARTVTLYGINGKVSVD